MGKVKSEAMEKFVEFEDKLREVDIEIEQNRYNCSEQAIRNWHEYRRKKLEEDPTLVFTEENKVNFLDTYVANYNFKFPE